MRVGRGSDTAPASRRAPRRTLVAEPLGRWLVGVVSPRGGRGATEAGVEAPAFPRPIVCRRRATRGVELLAGCTGRCAIGPLTDGQAELLE